MSQDIRVEGLSELRETLLKRLPEKLQGKALQGALRKAATPIVRQARQRAPENTGRLRKAIYSYRDRKSTKTREGRLIGVRSGKRFGTKDAYYWKFLEFGHGVISRTKKSEAGRVLGTPSKGWFGREVKAYPARPFMRPAFESQKLNSLEIVRKTLADEIETVARKAYAKSLNRLRRNVLGI